MNLYEINHEFNNYFNNHIDEETGEFTGSTEEFEAITAEREDKIENLALWIKNMKAEAKAIKDEEDHLKSRREVLENKAESVKKFLNSILGGEKFKTPKVSVSYTTSHSVELEDDWYDKVQANFIKYADPTPDKAAIKAALNDGIVVPGAHIVDKTNIIIK